MEITETRRAMLKKWFEQRTIPPKEKSYLSQLMTGTASFGERAARRLEKDYGMGHMYLDGAQAVESEVDSATNTGIFEVKSTAATAVGADEVDLMWVTAYGRKLLTLAYSTDEDGRAAIMRTAEAMPRVIRPAAVSNKH